jgi:hypothetical protein
MRKLLSISFVLLFLLTASYGNAQPITALSAGTPVLSLNANASAAPQTGTVFAIPTTLNTLTWIVSFAVTPGSQTTNLEFSNDNVLWQTGDTSTLVTGEARTVFTAARFVRVTEAARTGGGAITVSITGAGAPVAVVTSGANLTGPLVVNRSNIGATSTDGIVANNATPATAGTTIQYGPRIRLTGNAWDTDDLVSRPVSWFIETEPSSAATVVGNLYFKYIDPVTSTVSTPMQINPNGGSFNVGGGINMGAAGFIGNLANSSGYIYFPSDGIFKVDNFAATIGNTIKTDALPTVSACGAGSPAVVAGSTPWYGAVTIGTTGVATCTITFNGAAFPTAPHCSGSVETTTAANVRAMGYLANTTTLTIVPSAAWADSSVVNWNCASAK